MTAWLQEMREMGEGTAKDTRKLGILNIFVILMCNNDFGNTHMSKLSKLCTFKCMYLLHTNYTLIKLFGKKHIKVSVDV